MSLRRVGRGLLTAPFGRAVVNSLRAPRTRVNVHPGHQGVGAARVALSAVALLGVSACYTYVPSTRAPTPGAEVRLELSDVGAQNLASTLGARVAAVDGRVEGVAPDSTVRLAVSSTRTYTGAAQPWEGEGTVAFAPSSYRVLRARRVSKWRTLGLIAGAVGAVALLLLQLGSDDGSGTPGPGGGGPPS